MTILREIRFALGLLIAGGPATAAAAAPDFAACEQIVDDDGLRDQVAAGARRAMRAALAAIDYKAIVEASWAKVRFDDKFARIVDAQIALLRQDRVYLERLLDGNVPSRAEEMARRTTEGVFNSPEFKALQRELQDDIGKRMEPLVASADLDAQTEASQCIKLYLGRRYAATVSSAFGAKARAATVKPTLDASGAPVTAAFSLAGVVAAMLTVVFRRLVRRIVTAVVRRLAGAIAARLAAWASVIIGVAVLVYELVAGADGVFPVIRDELTSPQTRTVIQTSLIDELSKVAPEQLDARADQLANDLVVRWRKFKAGHRAVLDLARRDETFRRFIEEQPPEEFERLSAVVEAIKASPPGGDEAVLDATRRGLLARALALPNVETMIETWAPKGVSLIALLEWHDRMPDRFDAILAARLPLHVKPDDLSTEALHRLLDLGDDRAAGRVAAMSEPARSEALALGHQQLLALTTRFDGPQLSALFDALRPSPTPDARARHLQTLEQNPGLIGRLENAAAAIAASAQPGAALEVLLSTNSSLDTAKVFDHLNTAYEGRIAPMVLFHRYGWGLVVAIAFPILIVLLLLRGLGRMLGLAGRRR